MYVRLALCAALAMAALLPQAFGAEEPTKEADAVLGLWTTEGGNARVEVYVPQKPKPGEEASKEAMPEDAVEMARLYGTYCGKIVWLKDPVYGNDDPEAGQPVRDRKNPDATKQSKPMVGLFMVKGFNYDGASKMWKDGTIYDPEAGKTYKCQMSFDPADPKKLNLRGYIGVPAFGRTTVWNRYEEPAEAPKEAPAAAPVPAAAPAAPQAQK